MVNLFKGFIEMQELYNSLEHQYDILHDHNRRRKEATRACDNMIDWKKYIKDIPDDFLVLNKLRLNKIEVPIET